MSDILGMKGEKLDPPMVMAAIPDFAFSALFFAVWVAPAVFGQGWVENFVLMMVLEFFVIHSSFFMASVIHSGPSLREKALGVFSLGLFYSLIIGAISYTAGRWGLLGAFWILIANRLMESLAGEPSGAGEAGQAKTVWIANAVFYIMAVTITSILPIPDFGGHGLSDIGGSTGMWVTEPQRAMVTGFIYFGASGYFQLKRERLEGFFNQGKAGN